MNKLVDEIVFILKPIFRRLARVFSLHYLIKRSCWWFAAQIAVVFIKGARHFKLSFLDNHDKVSWVSLVEDDLIHVVFLQLNPLVNVP